MAGIQKRYLKEVDTAGSFSKLQALTSTSTATAVLPYGVTTITAGTTVGTNNFALASPKVAGVHKYIAVTVATTDAPILSQASTATTFFGSTNGLATFSTGAGEKFLSLVATSTSVWAVVGQSTGVTFSA